MPTKELAQDNYITELGQIGALVNKYPLTCWYVGTISPSPNYQTREMPMEEPSIFRQGYALTLGSVIMTTIRQQGAPVPGELLAYQSRNEEVATFPITITAQGKGAWAFSVAGRSDTASTSASAMEELRELLRKDTKDWVEVYPGYRVSLTEYERRFKGVDLDHFRRVLPSKLFKAYVDTMASVEGLGIEPQYTYKGKD